MMWCSHFGKHLTVHGKPQAQHQFVICVPFITCTNCVCSLKVMMYKYCNSSHSPSSPQHTPVTLALTCTNWRLCINTHPPPSPNLHLIIVSREGWLGKLANNKDENNSAEAYFGSFLTMCNPLFFVHKLWLNKLIWCFYWSVSSKW